MAASSEQASEIDKLIREIASAHGVALSKDDPLLMLQTVQLHLVEQLHEKQTELLAQFASSIELAMATAAADSTSKAERIVNAALEAAKRMVAQSNEQATAELAHVMDRKRQEFIDAIQENATGYRNTQLIGLGVSVVALVASLLSFFS